MNAEAKVQLAEKWVDHYSHTMVWGPDMVLQRQSLHPEAVDALGALSYEDPEAFLDVVLEIVHRSENDEALMHVSCLLQVLLETQTPRVLPRIESMAVVDSAFRSLLAWFIPTEPKSELWSRIRLIAGDVPW